MNEKTKRLIKCAVIRAVRTVCQTAVATIGTATVIGAVDWRMVISASLLAGIISMLTSIGTGLPEVEIELEDIEDIEEEENEDVSEGD